MDVGVLLCRGNRLLTGSNTRWLRLWEVEAVRGVKPWGNACRVNERFAARCLWFVCLLYRAIASSPEIISDAN